MNKEFALNTSSVCSCSQVRSFNVGSSCEELWWYIVSWCLSETKAVVTATIGRGDGFEPIRTDHASGCPLEPCLHRGTFINRVPILHRVYTVETFTPYLHRTYTVSTPCLHASAETTRTRKITRCILKSLYTTYTCMCDRYFVGKKHLLSITQLSYGIV
jgi:hypothetical protein